MAKYDESILQRYADRLYEQAFWTIVRSVILWFFLGAIAAFVPSWWANYVVRVSETVSVGDEIYIGLVGGALIGVLVGVRKAFEYKLKAQLTLCQMQIERNTRSL